MSMETTCSNAIKRFSRKWESRRSAIGCESSSPSNNSEIKQYRTAKSEIWWVITGLDMGIFGLQKYRNLFRPLRLSRTPLLPPNPTPPLLANSPPQAAGAGLGKRIKSRHGRLRLCLRMPIETHEAIDMLPKAHGRTRDPGIIATHLPLVQALVADLPHQETPTKPPRGLRI